VRSTAAIRAFHRDILLPSSFVLISAIVRCPISGRASESEKRSRDARFNGQPGGYRASSIAFMVGREICWSELARAIITRF